jgi:uncharacterized membrane protein
MESKAKIFGHPIHQMLVAFPLGLLGASLIFDIVHFVTGDGKWAEFAFWMIALGIATGLMAGVFGLIDFLAIPGRTRAKSGGVWHGLGNAVVLGLFAISCLLRWPNPSAPAVSAVILSAIGVGFAIGTSWLGGELVDQFGVGVNEGANLNAPNSLSGRPAANRRSSLSRTGLQGRA